MQRSLWSAASGMTAQQMNIDVLSNNLSNVNTAGFKKSRAFFQDLMYQELKAAGTYSAAGLSHPTGIEIGLGTKISAVEKVHSQGSLQTTSVETDVAIQGKGYFQFTMPNGDIGYTRSGSLKIDANGNLTNENGYLLEPAVTIPDNTSSISIGEDGTISVSISGENEPQEVGQIELANFINPSGLKSIGRNFYMPTGASGEAVTGAPGETNFGTVEQGTLEMSNVSVVEDMVNMITAQRAYEINSKAIQTSDDMLQILNSLKR
ncbi:flagellar basal-body rod protein FlgG [Seleniivibrio woodruffii]|uniref:flagellar basal-body rod protein FlgG n=1 Tax=Seleniivibrio woodruffii TaxID=1078050 RepID=UPI0026EB62FA|nr:flagellar basal-body rod protein FlgG [Seleniivibrio woodruffii]